MALSKEYEEGAQFARKNGFLCKNPYPKGSAEYNDFDRGWSQEIKKNYGDVAYADALRKRENNSSGTEKKKATGVTRESYRKEKDGY